MTNNVLLKILKVITINLRHNLNFWEERFPLIADEIVRLKLDLLLFNKKSGNC